MYFFEDNSYLGNCFDPNSPDRFLRTAKLPEDDALIAGDGIYPIRLRHKSSAMTLWR
jgi:hypothetical protein